MTRRRVRLINSGEEYKRGLVGAAVADQARQHHYSVKEISEMWNLDESTIRKMFIDEPGVFRYGHPGIRSKRRQYITLRIPEAVLLRVYSARLKVY
jgi:hypothetical protein